MSQTSNEFVTISLCGQLLGIPVLLVQDVLKPQLITRVPLAPNWVAGVLNLRGRIVTAIDLRARLGLPPRGEGERAGMSVVVEYKGEPYSLLIDRVGEVLSLDDALFEKNPVTLDPRWREVSNGIYRLEDQLLVVLDVNRLLEQNAALAA
ncbi:MAG: chemotaxis protein CheW [Sphingomonadales bacterium]|nr:MAG: chemotaxis protein CheW [Sphingomonadales bacterium]